MLAPVLAWACAEHMTPNARGPGPVVAQPRSPAPAPVQVVPASNVEASPPIASWPPKNPTPTSSDFCTESVRALDAGTCYFLPEQPTDVLLVYLHGIVPPGASSPQKTTYQAIVASACGRAGVAALLPRGRKGLAPDGLADWWGWPTSTSTYKRFAPELVQQIVDSQRAFERATGVAFRRVYLAGSSSGAYFVATLAQKGDIRVDGYGAMSGGTPILAPRLASLTPRPVYIGYGLYDTVGKSARELGQLFGRANWPVRVAEHRVGHGAKEIYLDEAFGFWNEHVRADAARLGEGAGGTVSQTPAGLPGAAELQ